MSLTDPRRESAAVWQREIDEIAQRKAFAERLGGEERIERQHASGRLTARERIDTLLDPRTFREIGSLTGTATYGESGELLNVVPANAVIGKGRVEGRPVAVSADDYTVRGGSSEATISDKWIFIERWALESRAPLVRLVDAAGGSIRLLEKSQSTKIPGYPSWPSTDLLATVPVVGVALGPCAGLGAVKVVMSHFSVMVAGTSQVFAGGPHVVAPGVGERIDKDELGGAQVHARGSGAVDNEASSEEDALAQVRRFLSFLPSSVFELPGRVPTDDPADRCDESLASAVPRNRRTPYKIREVIASLLDRDSTFEIGRLWGRSAVTLLGRLNGLPVGLMATDPYQLGGAVTADSAEKISRFIDLCDTFHIPIVNLVDQPGVFVGRQAEERGTIRRALRARMAIAQATVPWSTVFLRRAFGVGGGMHGPLNRATVRYAWPSAYWGSIPVEGGVEAAYRRDIADSPDPESRRQELIEYYHRLESPFRTAERFGIEEIIDPRQTRPLLCEWVEEAYRVLPEHVGVTCRTFRI